MVGWNYTTDAGHVAFPHHGIVAMVLVVLGVGLVLAGGLEFRRAKTTVNPLTPRRASTVVDTGIYRLTRNPMYLGMAVALLGLAAWTSTLLGYALVPVFSLYMTQFQIKPEERALLNIFGPAFTAYMAKVRRWI